MSTKTVVKIKRKRDAEPTFSFVVASKRSKLSNDLTLTDTDSTSNDVNETVFHFVTTVNEHAVLNKDEVSKKVKNAIALLPTEPQGCAISEGAEYKEEVVPDFLMEKIQKLNQEKQDILCNSVQMIREKLTLDNSTTKEQADKDDDYVYDVYWCQNQNNIASWKIEDVIYLQPYQYIEEERSSTHSNYDDDDDSNDENNWRNDYPDELDSDSDNEERYYYGDDGGYSRKSYYNDDDNDGCDTDEDYY